MCLSSSEIHGASESQSNAKAGVSLWKYWFEQCHSFVTIQCCRIEISRASTPESNFLGSLDLKPCPIFSHGFGAASERLRMRTLPGIRCWPQKDSSCWMSALSYSSSRDPQPHPHRNSPADSASQATFFSIFSRQETATGNQSFRHISAMFSDRK